MIKIEVINSLFETYLFTTTETNIENLYRVYYGWDRETNPHSRNHSVKMTGRVVVNMLFKHYRKNKHVLHQLQNNCTRPVILKPCNKIYHKLIKFD